MYNKRDIGEQYEERAVSYLIEQGYEIIDRNFYSRHNEIDIIAKENGYIVFLEVKYRKDNAKGNPLEAITYWKRKSIIKAAKYYLYKKFYGRDVSARFDVVSIEGDRILLVKDAFWME